MIVEYGSEEPGRRGRPNPLEAARRMMAAYGVFERGVLEAAASVNGGEMPLDEAEGRRRELLAWMEEGDLASSLGPGGLDFMRTPVGAAAEADYRDSLESLEFAAALAWALRLRRSLGPVDSFTDPLALAAALPEPFGPAPPFSVAIRTVPDGALRGALHYCNRWCWRAEVALSNAFSFDGLAAMRAGTVRVVARKAFEEGIIDEVLDGDFPLNGVPFRNLSRDEAERVATVTGTRASALAWLLGDS